MKKSSFRRHVLLTVCPALGISAVTGISAAVLVCLFKLLAAKAGAAAEALVAQLSGNLILLAVAIPLLFLIAYLLSLVLKREPDLRGGGIPASLGLIRGYFRFSPLKNLVGTMGLSLLSFLLGAPLGTEGPSVQMGCASGALVTRLFPKKRRAWERYAMTGGACAGFCVATGAPLSGILFALEEAHRRISPLIVLSSVISVLFAEITSTLLSPLIGVSKTLFDLPFFSTLQPAQLWIPLLVGSILGLFSTLFLIFYEKMDRLICAVKARVPYWLVIVAVLLLTLLFALVQPSFAFSGHHLILSLFTQRPTLPVLIAILVVRSFLTVSANGVGLTGGTFLPQLAIGATLSALIASAGGALGMDETTASIVMVLGICGCIAGMMQMPLTAIFFSVEALGCSDNLLSVILTAALSYLIPVFFGKESSHELALSRRVATLSRGQAQVLILTMQVQEGAFAVGKEVRDVFWPAGAYVLSLRGSEVMEKGTELRIRVPTRDRAKLLEEMYAIVGEGEILSEEVETK